MHVFYVSLRLAAAGSEVGRKYTKAEIVAAGTNVGMKVVVQQAFRRIEDTETFSRTAALRVLQKAEIDDEECEQVIARLEVGVSQVDVCFVEVVRCGATRWWSSPPPPHKHCAGSRINFTWHVSLFVPVVSRA